MSTKETGAPEVRKADTIVIRSFTVICPHCGEEQSGWLGAPGNGEYACDDCGKPYQVVDTPTMRFF